MRSLLFIPGHSTKMMAKAATSGADVVIFDLEDAVHPDSKEAARPLVVQALGNRAGAGPACYVRVNALGSRWCTGDLETVMPARPDGIMLPKPDGPEDLDRLDALMSRWEHASQKGQTKIIPVCTETPAATLSLAAKSWARPRLAGLVWGGEDLSAAIGAHRQPRRGRPLYRAVRAGPQPLPAGCPRRQCRPDRRGLHRLPRQRSVAPRNRCGAPRRIFRQGRNPSVAGRHHQ